MNYVLIASFVNEDDANEYCANCANGTMVAELMDGTYGVYKPLN